MASPFDQRLIDPTDDELVATLRKAQAAANRRLHARVLRMMRDTAFWGRFARDCRRSPEGRRRSCKAGPQTPEVVAGWWTDPAGRRHYRVVGRARQAYNFEVRGEGELRGLPPWWQVYPESLLAIRRPDGSERFLACCRCGAVGSPGSLGWMGNTCGPCFDRWAEGGIPVGGFGHFGGWHGPHSRFAFSADGSRLLGKHLSTRLRLVDRANGAESLGRGSTEQLAAALEAPDGYLFANMDGTICRWTGDDTPAEVVLKRPELPGIVTLDPHGRRAVIIGQGYGFTADLTAEQPRYVRHNLRRWYSMARYDPTGARILGVTTTRELVAIDPETLTEYLADPNAFGEGVRYVFRQEMAIALDGSAIALVREREFSAGTAVRVISLPVGTDRTGDLRQPIDLVVPWWHRPIAAAFSPDRQHLLTADSFGGWVGFWRLPDATCVGFARAVPEDPNWLGGQVAFAPDGRAVGVLYAGARAERGSTVVVWPWPDVLQAVAE